MGKPTICKDENKDADQLAVTEKLISVFVFATRIVQFLFYLNPKFQASSSFLCLYRPVCVRPVRKPHCWFSHEAAQIVNKQHKCPLYKENRLVIQLIQYLLYNANSFVRLFTLIRRFLSEALISSNCNER